RRRALRCLRHHSAIPSRRGNWSSDGRNLGVVDLFLGSLSPARTGRAMASAASGRGSGLALCAAGMGWEHGTLALGPMVERQSRYDHGLLVSLGAPGALASSRCPVRVEETCQPREDLATAGPIT